MTSSPTELPVRDQRLYQLLDCADDGIFEIDPEGRCTYINASGARLLGYQSPELMGFRLHDIVHPDGQSLAPAECAICQEVTKARALNRSEPAPRIRGVLSRKGGRGLPVSYAVVQILIEDRLQGSVFTFSDDAEHGRLTAELRERTTELAESEQRKTEFIATMAHELRNPLAPLRAALQIMRKASENATSMAQLRAVMERQLEQLVHLVNDLLDVARVNSGQVTLKKERIALQEILQAALEASEPVRQTTQHVLKLEVPSERVYLNADATRLTQVFTNILNNAAQYSATGGPITVRIETDGSRVRIVIADAGVGIAREALNRIFDLFTRVGRETNAPHEGLGIGLNLARRLVELHEGQLVAESEGPGKGSRFVITLPLPPRAQEELSPENGPSGARSLVRALIVDDNIDAAETLSLLLNLGGHTTALAHDGAEALKVAAEFKPDIVLLDLGLPGMDGFEVARAIRRMPEIGRPFLAAVTGWGGAEDRARTKQAGFDEHLTKPVDISMIELLLATLSARRRNDGGSPPLKTGNTLNTPH